MAEGAWLAWMQCRPKVLTCSMQICQTTAYMNVLLQKFPCLYRFQSAVVFSGRPTTELGAEQDFFLLVLESFQGRSKDGWLRVRRRFLATARSSFPFIFYESNLVPSATAHIQEVFGQQAVFARVWLFEVRRPTLLLGLVDFNCGARKWIKCERPTCRSLQNNQTHNLTDIRYQDLSLKVDICWRTYFPM